MRSFRMLAVTVGGIAAGGSSAGSHSVASLGAEQQLRASSACSSIDSAEACTAFKFLGVAACEWCLVQGACYLMDSTYDSCPPQCCASKSVFSSCHYSKVGEIRDGTCPQPAEPTNTTAFSPAVAQRLVQLAGASYCSSTMIRNWSCFLHCNAAANVTDAVVFDNGPFHLQGFAAWDAVLGRVVVAFRGTAMKSVVNWVDNLKFLQMAPYEGLGMVRVHEGFYADWVVLREQVFSGVTQLVGKHNAPLLITGHSLGGALATLAAFELSQHFRVDQVVTFGAPRVGNVQFHLRLGRQVPNFWRVTHNADLVPHVPPQAAGYYHGSREVFYLTSTEYQVCNGSGEDPACSNQFFHLSPTYHVSYLGSHMGNNMCVKTPPVLV